MLIKPSRGPSSIAASMTNSDWSVNGTGEPGTGHAAWAPSAVSSAKPTTPVAINAKLGARRTGGVRTVAREDWFAFMRGNDNHAGSANNPGGGSGKLRRIVPPGRRRLAGSYNLVVEVDLYQLPIPDWGLHCPSCEYPLRGLPSHRCPECGLVLDMAAIAGTWMPRRPPRFDGSERPLPDFGLDCRSCGKPLAGATDNQCPHCGAAFDVLAARPTRKWFRVDRSFCRGVPAVIVESRLQSEGVPHVRGSELGIATVLGMPPDPPLLVPREFYFEACRLVQELIEELAAARKEHNPAFWKCPQCGEEVPRNFEVCWSCGAGRRVEC